MVLTPDALEPVERTILGVLSLGLPPSRAAGDETFRVDVCSAMALGLERHADDRRYLMPGAIRITPAFGGQLKAALASLAQRGVIADQPADMPAAAGNFEAGLDIDLINPDAHPAVLDRYLAQQCLEGLLNTPSVYPFLMQQYARAGEFWRRARDDGYGR